jgi:hypothetical protein
MFAVNEMVDYGDSGSTPPAKTTLLGIYLGNDHNVTALNTLTLAEGAYHGFLRAKSKSFNIPH